MLSCKFLALFIITIIICGVVSAIGCIKYTEGAVSPDIVITMPVSTPTSTPTPSISPIYKMPWEDKTPNLIELPNTWYLENGMTSYRDSPGDILYYHDNTRGVGIWILRNVTGNSYGIGVLPDSEYCSK